MGRVAFLHPDLGLGGAERLVVDAALELVAAGYTVDVYTTYHDPQRCFEETRDCKGGFQVLVAGDWFPRHIAGRFLAMCAYIRCILAALYITWLGLIGKVSKLSRKSRKSAIASPVDASLPAVSMLHTCSKKFNDVISLQQ